MILYYNSWIQETIQKCWTKDHVLSQESNVKVNIPESEIKSHESFNLKDPKIPILYKKAIVKTLYDGKSEWIKTNVWKHQEVWHEGVTIHTDDKEDRQLLVHEYQRYVHSLLQHHMSSVISDLTIPSQKHVRATLPPSMLFADSMLPRKGHAMSMAKA